ncbi:MAG: ABZJ_00895 family protein [Halopseudomonas sp.]|uniref:ABZJ_00895 family protein n=1 Tax=Halopseudomonas sp. TaxID=2901191 RepID=UPI0030033140
MQPRLPLLSCTLGFLGVYLLLAVATGAAQLYFDLNLGVVASVVTLTAATCVVVLWVVRRRWQPLSVSESLRLALCCVLATWAFIALVLAAVLLSLDQASAYLAMLDPATLRVAALAALAYWALVLLWQWALYYVVALLYYRAVRAQLPSPSSSGEHT